MLAALQLAVIVNSADPLSVAIGDYYVSRRHIPAANVLHVSFDPAGDELPVTQFLELKAAIDKQAGAGVQAFALTWAHPYRVGCMSITSAFAFGFDTRYCANGCVATQVSPYFNSSTSHPYDQLHMRPTMALAASDLAHAKALIDRGVESDGTAPRGTAYLVETNDVARNVRALEYRQAATVTKGRMQVEVDKAVVQDRSDVMFYFIGAATVSGVDSNRFLPGAIADHLTSFGGMLTDSSQMSSLRWLEAGATGSYGSVVEPCNILTKFPHVAALMYRYVGGDTLIEAYWGSVLMPGQGLFIGEPLAAPFRGR